MAVSVPPLLHRPALFVGREAEPDLLRDAFARVPVAPICGVAGVGKSALASAFAAGWPGLVVRSDVGGDDLAVLVDDAARLLGTRSGPTSVRSRLACAPWPCASTRRPACGWSTISIAWRRPIAGARSAALRLRDLARMTDA